MRLENRYGGNVIDLGPVAVETSVARGPFGLGLEVQPRTTDDGQHVELAVDWNVWLGGRRAFVRVGVFVRKPGRIIGQG